MRVSRRRTRQALRQSKFSPPSPIPDIVTTVELWVRWLHWRVGVIALHEVDEYVTHGGRRIVDPHHREDPTMPDITTEHAAGPGEPAELEAEAPPRSAVVSVQPVAAAATAPPAS